MQQSEVVQYISVNEKVREDTRDAILQLLGLDNVPGNESPHYQSLLNAIHDNHTVNHKLSFISSGFNFKSQNYEKFDYGIQYLFYSNLNL